MVALGVFRLFWNFGLPMDFMSFRVGGFGGVKGFMSFETLKGSGKEWLLWDLEFRILRLGFSARALDPEIPSKP